MSETNKTNLQEENETVKRIKQIALKKIKSLINKMVETDNQMVNQLGQLADDMPPELDDAIVNLITVLRQEAGDTFGGHSDQGGSKLLKRHQKISLPYPAQHMHESVAQRLSNYFMGYKYNDETKCYEGEARPELVEIQCAVLRAQDEKIHYLLASNKNLDLLEKIKEDFIKSWKNLEDQQQNLSEDSLPRRSETDICIAEAIRDDRIKVLSNSIGKTIFKLGKNTELDCHAETLFMGNSAMAEIEKGLYENKKMELMAIKGTKRPCQTCAISANLCGQGYAIQSGSQINSLSKSTTNTGGLYLSNSALSGFIRILVEYLDNQAESSLNSKNIIANLENLIKNLSDMVREQDILLTQSGPTGNSSLATPTHSPIVPSGQSNEDPPLFLLDGPTSGCGGSPPHSTPPAGQVGGMDDHCCTTTGAAVAAPPQGGSWRKRSRGPEYVATSPPKRYRVDSAQSNGSRSTIPQYMQHTFSSAAKQKGQPTRKLLANSI